MSNNIAVVIGASGLVGEHLVNLLSKDCTIDKVITLTRRPFIHACEKVENHQVDFDHLSQHEALFHGRWLFSCLGSTKKQAGSISAQRKVDIDYQLGAATIAVKNGMTHYLLVSSSGANQLSKSPYLKMKGELEQKISALPFEKITVLRPSLLLGKRKHLRLGENIGAIFLPIFNYIPGLKMYRPIESKIVAQRLLVQAHHQSIAKEHLSSDKIFI